MLLLDDRQSVGPVTFSDFVSAGLRCLLAFHILEVEYQIHRVCIIKSKESTKDGHLQRRAGIALHEDMVINLQSTPHPLLGTADIVCEVGTGTGAVS